MLLLLKVQKFLRMDPGRLGFLGQDVRKLGRDPRLTFPVQFRFERPPLSLPPLEEPLMGP